MVQEEIIALSQMAEQLNTKFSNTSIPPPPMPGTNVDATKMNGHAPSAGAIHQQSNESVDLDNLFAFLSEVQPTPSSKTSNPVLEEIGERMDSLVNDLDVEVSLDGIRISLIRYCYGIFLAYSVGECHPARN